MLVQKIFEVKGRGQVVLVEGTPTALTIGWCLRAPTGGVWEIVGKDTPGGKRQAALTLRKLAGPDIKEGDEVQVDLGAMVIRKKAKKLRIFLSQLSPQMRSRFLNSVLRDFCQYCGDEIAERCNCMRDE